MSVYKPYPPMSGFVAVSEKIILAKHGNHLTAAEFKTLLALYHYHRLGWPHWVKEYVSHQAGVSRPTYNKCYKSLEEKGWLTHLENFKESPKSFSKLPLSILEDKKITGAVCKVYCYIALRLGIKNWDFSAKRIAKDIGASARTVENALRTLESKKLLVRKRKTNTNRVKYYLFYLHSGKAITIHEKAKAGEYGNDTIFWYYQEYLRKHDDQWNEKHIHLRNDTIREQCELLHSILGNYEAYNDIISFMDNFLGNKSRSSDYHFPVFIRYVFSTLGEGYELFQDSSYDLTQCSSQELLSSHGLQ